MKLKSKYYYEELYCNCKDNVKEFIVMNIPSGMNLKTFNACNINKDSALINRMFASNIYPCRKSVESIRTVYILKDLLDKISNHDSVISRDTIIEYLASVKIRDNQKYLSYL